MSKWKMFTTIIIKKVSLWDANRPRKILDKILDLFNFFDINVHNRSTTADEVSPNRKLC